VTAATGLVGSEGWLIGLRFVAGLLAGAAITLGFAVLFAGAPASQRGRVISTATIVQMGAAAVGSLLGGVAVTLGGVPTAFAAAAVPVLIVVGIDLVRPARGYWSALSPGGSRGESPRAASETAATRVDRGRGPLLPTLALVSFALFFARFAGEQGLLPVLAYERGGLTPLTLGAAFALGTAASAAALALVGRWVDAGGRTAVIAVSLVGIVAATALFGVLTSPLWFGGAIIVYAVATSMANIVPSVVTAEAFPGRRSGAAVGVTRTAGDVGAAVGPLAVFGLVDLLGAWSGLLLLAVVPAVAMTVLLVQLRRP
jgi:MFS family permease